jgi:hypothetical protein
LCFPGIGTIVTMAKEKTDPIAEAIHHTLTSPNVADSNFEAANVVDALDSIAKAIWALAAAVREVGTKLDKQRHDDEP